MNDRKKKNCAKTRLEKNYCEKCGFKINSENHEQGDHHKKGSEGKYDPSRYN